MKNVTVTDQVFRKPSPLSYYMYGTGFGTCFINFPLQYSMYRIELVGEKNFIIHNKKPRF